MTHKHRHTLVLSHDRDLARASLKLHNPKLAPSALAHPTPHVHTDTPFDANLLHHCFVDTGVPLWSEIISKGIILKCPLCVIWHVLFVSNERRRCGDPKRNSGPPYSRLPVPSPPSPTLGIFSLFLISLSHWTLSCVLRSVQREWPNTTAGVASLEAATVSLAVLFCQQLNYT